MMRKISEIFGEKDRTFSMEVFPPKTTKGLEPLCATVETLSELGPDYFSVTYGAGGSTTKMTRAVINELHGRFDLTCVHHLTLVSQTREQLSEIIRQTKSEGIRNILALRGDPPPEMGTEFRKVDGGLEFCYELIDLIKQVSGDYFSIGVAGFPEGHPACPSKELDTQYLKIKVDHGAEFAVTQFFFENEIYSQYLERTARAGVDIRIIPGVLPITNYDKLISFAERCGAYICQRIHDTFQALRDDPEMTMKQGIEYAVEQCADLLRRGAPGLHFYCLNQVEPARTVWKHVVGM